MVKVFFISKENVREAWLSAIGQVLYNGDDIKTEYDKPEDPPSKDATVLIEIKAPMSNPIMRKDKFLSVNFAIYGIIVRFFREEIRPTVTAISSLGSLKLNLL